MVICLYWVYSLGICLCLDVYFIDLIKIKFEKSLMFGKKVCSGWNNRGLIILKGRGGVYKCKYCIVDFKWKLFLIVVRVVMIEYDLNWNVCLVFLYYDNGVKKYILVLCLLKIGMEVCVGKDVLIEIGNVLLLVLILLGSIVYNVELILGKGG